MIRLLPDEKGFLMIEVIIAIMILAICFPVFMGSMAQAYRGCSASYEVGSETSALEGLVFELETGIRPELTGYGGSGERDGFWYKISASSRGDYFSWLELRLNRKNGQGLTELAMTVSKAPAR